MTIGASCASRDARIIKRLCRGLHSGWQRDLSVSYDNIGDVQVTQGDLKAALKSYSDSLAIRERLAQSDLGNADWHVRVLRQHRQRAGGAGRSQGRAKILFRQPRHFRAPGDIRPWQCGLAARSLG